MNDSSHKPSLNEIAPGVLNKSDQNALDFYLSGGRRQTQDRIAVDHRRISSKLDIDIPGIVRMKQTQQGSEQEARMVNYFQDTAPLDRGESIILLDGFSKYIEPAATMLPEEGEQTVTDSYNRFAAYLYDAAHDVSILEGALTDQIAPDASFVRQSDEILRVIQKNLMMRSFLWDKKWPDITSEAYERSYKFWRGFVLAAARFANDDSITELYDFAKKRSSKRLDGLITEFAIAKTIPIVRKLETEGKVVAVPLNKLSAYKPRPQENDAQAIESSAEEGSWFESRLPPDVKRQEELRAFLHDLAWEQMDRAHVPPEDIRRELVKQGTAPIEEVEGHIVSPDYLEEQARNEETARKLRTSNPAQKTHKPRPFRKPRFGWGAHASDGDKRGKTSRELEGQDTLF